ncbi:hypothetical protein [Actinomadura alba]|uniref:Flagellin N-terminal-like domain-containing protein n=1 Tax=Actinomadura alba TaxID=406431 RepID=A0ABR7LQP6_9ACTN|nr:hypothetical protein [Actinomadura alba]MBC6467066.1 hypothetical protein [Actinomadura alba]
MNLMRNRLALLRKGDDRGDQFVGWLSLIVIAVLIFGALIAAGLPKLIGDSAKAKVEQVTGTDTGGGPKKEP